MTLPRYGEYKDSGVEWLGEVPGHWACTRMGRYIQVLSGFAFPSSGFSHDESDVKLLRGVNVGVNEIRWDDTVYWRRNDDDGLNAYELSAGDIVLGMDRPWISKGIRIARLSVPDIPCLLLQRVALIRTTPHLTSDFAFRLLDTTAFISFLEPDTTGVSVPHISPSQISSFPVAIPPLPEQTAIAAFLDRETGKIDALVAEQEKLIALLKEKRQAVISHAVTKGLDPAAPMKDSGIEWLGEVPAHWEVRRIKDVARLESGHTPSKQVPEYWENCDIPWVSLNDSKQLAVTDYISETAIQINARGLANSSARLLPAGAVVFTRDATIGLSAITARPMAVSQHLIAWCPSEKINALYLLRVFNAMKSFLDAYTNGATIKTIGMPEVRKLVTTVPPLHEQVKITQFIERATANIDVLTAEAQRAIDLLKERRTALISAAVTGKIDVRGLVDVQEAA